MDVELVEIWTRRAAIAALGVFVAAVLGGLAAARRRPRGRSSGAGDVWRRPGGALLLVVGSALAVGACWMLWQQVPLTLASGWRIAALSAGASLYFLGMGVVVWGRMVLGRMWNVSSTAGAELYADHRLATGGPYAFVRHPMYVGWFVAVLGGVLLFRTRTALLFLAVTPVFLVRARREEALLAAQFGAEWDAYVRRVGRMVPRIRRRPQ